MAYTPVRILPDADELLLDVLRAATVTVFAEPPANLWALVESGPVAICYRFGGTTPDPRFKDRATVQAIAYGRSRKVAADLAETVRAALWTAARHGGGNDDGYLNSFTEVVAPTSNPDPGLPDRVWRFDATYSLSIRPRA